MKFDIKQTAGDNFMVGLVIASFLWLLFGWALSAFHFAKVFVSINYYGLAKWLASDLPFKAPLILFWFIILFILAVLWLVCLIARTVNTLKKPTTRPIYKGAQCALYIVAALLIIGHVADTATTTRISNIPVAKEGTVSFKSGLEITLGELNYTSGDKYINLPLKVEPHNILRSDWDLEANTATIGIKPPGAGVVYNDVIMSKPFNHNSINVIIEKFYSEQGSLAAAGVEFTLSKKPLMPFLIVLYLLLAFCIIIIMAAPRFERAAFARAEPEPAPKLPPKISGKTAIAKPKKKNKNR